MLNQGNNDEILGYIETVFHPLAFDEDRFTLYELGKMALNSNQSFRGWPFLPYAPQYRSDTIMKYDNRIEILFNSRLKIHNQDLGLNYNFCVLMRSGLVYTIRLMASDKMHPNKIQTRYLHFGDFTLTVAEAINSLIKFYENFISNTESIYFNVNLIGTAQRMFLLTESEYSDFTFKDNKIGYSKTRTLIEWKSGLVDHAVEILKDIDFRVGCQNRIDYERVKELIRKTLLKEEQSLFPN